MVFLNAWGLVDNKNLGDKPTRHTPMADVIPTLPLSDYFAAVARSIASLDEAAVASFIERLREARDAGHTVYTCGNGGSAATASHFVADLLKTVSYKKKAAEPVVGDAVAKPLLRFKALCLNDNTSVMMAYANDVSYADVFVEPLRNFVQPHDVVVGISGSGNSENVIRAIDLANAAGAFTVGICGYDGGRLRQKAKLPIWVDNDHMLQVEDVHMSITHAVTCTLMGDR